MPRDRSVRLAAVGSAAGLFSGLFGVGGGAVIVPLLILWIGYDERRATATSLGAIVVIAAAGVATNGAVGSVDVGKAALVGLPAVAGVLFGTWLQQRVSLPVISLLFSLLLVVIAAGLVLA